jgi:rod shape-determining protein MreC
MNAPGGIGGGREVSSLGLRFSLLAVVSLVSMVVDHRDDHLSQVRHAFSIAVYPIEIAVNFPFKTWRWATISFAARTTLLSENAELKGAQLNYDGRLQRMAALEAENIRLREMLDSSARVDDRVLVAEILSVDLDPYRQHFLINRGLKDGVYIGQALLDANGVVGQIVGVEVFTSEAVLISDADHAVPVSVNRNGLRTIAIGTGDSGRLRLPYLTNSADIEVGDLLVSSGLGEVFPSGYPVGRVLKVERRPGQSFAEVIAEPAAELDRDREVLLVWAEEDPDNQYGTVKLVESE